MAGSIDTARWGRFVAMSLVAALGCAGRIAGTADDTVPSDVAPDIAGDDLAQDNADTDGLDTAGGYHGSDLSATDLFE